MTSGNHLVADVVVLGVGTGGEYAARKLAEAGLEVVAVERGLVGGECPFAGCTPSKLLLRSADVLAEGRRIDELAGRARIEPDLAAAARRVREATHDWHDDAHAGPLEEAGARLLRGHGRLAGTGRVEVATDGGTVLVEARRGVLLNTGTEPAVPPVPGLDRTPYWTNREALRATEAPASLVVMGGGPIGCELTQVFARFGSSVTLVETAAGLLPGEEPEAGAALARVLREEGVDVRTDTEVEEVDPDGDVGVRLSDGTTVRAERLLVATGRRPLLADLGLETVGLDPGAGVVEVDPRLRAGERLWAVGDITGKGAYTHVAKYQAAGAVADILDRPIRPADYRAVTRVTYTDPEVAGVGLTLARAREAGLAVRVGRADIARSSRGWIHGATGLVTVVADAERDVLVGGTVVAPYGGEVLGLLAAAVHAEIPIDTLRGMHFAYPTFHRTIEAALADLASDGG